MDELFFSIQICIFQMSYTLYQGTRLGQALKEALDELEVSNILTFLSNSSQNTICGNWEWFTRVTSSGHKNVNPNIMLYNQYFTSKTTFYYI